MTTIDTLYHSIVSQLQSLGAISPYKADANEPDPNYLSYGVRRAGKAQVFKDHRAAIKQLSDEEKRKLAYCLLESGYGEQQEIALLILAQILDYYTPEKVDEINWIIHQMRGWSKVDSYVGSFLHPLLNKYPDTILGLAKQWNKDSNRWLRRTSVVLFTRKVGSAGLHTDEALALCDNLVFDTEDLVLKGVGWALKDILVSDRPRIISYIKELRARGVSSVVTLYAIRNIKGEERKEILSVSKV